LFGWSGGRKLGGNLRIPLFAGIHGLQGAAADRVRTHADFRTLTAAAAVSAGVLRAVSAEILRSVR
jgi:hypothetical protein